MKARIVMTPTARADRQLSALRSWDFDAALIVLFDDDFSVWRASKIATAPLQEAARFTPYVNAERMYATDELMLKGEDWTERLRDAIP